jgi:4-amino-4-deoxy-L-arabinose transferase-like glycosyltransferase
MTPGGGGRAAGRRFLVILALIGAAAFAGRVAYVVLETRHLGHPQFGTAATGVNRSFDEFYYTQAAVALSDGDGLRFSSFAGAPPAEQALHPPLTAVLLVPSVWLTENNETVIRLPVVLAGVGVVFLLGLIGREIAGDRAGLVAAGLGALYPNLWVNDGILLSETFATFGTAAAVYFTYRLLRHPSTGYAIALGLSCAFAMLSRSELALLVPLLVVPAVVLARSLTRRRRVALAAIACVAAGITVAPWVVHDLTRFDEPVFLSYGAGSVLQGANCDATYGGERLGYWDGTCNTLGRVEGDASSYAAAQRRAGLDYMRDHLEELPAVVTARVARMWSVYRPAQMARDNENEGRPYWVSVAGLAFYYPLVLLAVGGAVVLARRGVTLFPLLVPIVITTLTAALFYGLVRFRVPAEVSLVVLGAVAIDALIARYVSRPRGLATVHPLPA